MDFEGIAHRGEYDMYLTQPIQPLFQVITGRSDVIAIFGHGLLGLSYLLIRPIKPVSALTQPMPGTLPLSVFYPVQYFYDAKLSYAGL